MFRCERCGAGFTPKEAKVLERCPTCRERDGVRPRLAFKLFSAAGEAPTALERCRRAAQRLGPQPSVSGQER